jgi:transcriptional repressor NrdR
LDSKVTDTRAASDENLIRRKRLCLGCGYKFFTNEVVCTEYPVVVKRNGREEEFEREKIRIGLMKAFKKCAGAEEKVDQIFHKTISQIVSKYPNKISSETIGSIVMDLLKADDAVAYLRFASVYKNFKTADDFAYEFEKISPQSPKP